MNLYRHWIGPSLARFSFRSVTVGVTLSLVMAYLPATSAAENANRRVLIGNVTSIQGVRENMLIGYGLVVGLDRTGDSQQTYFTVQTLANAMQKMGVLISPALDEVRNVAAVFVTASLPPFARPGERLDVTVSSVGDATSLAGGVLLMSALRGPDGKVYADAQGPLVIGGYTVGDGMNGKQVNSTTVGIIPNGGIVERDTAVDVSNFKTVSLLLTNPDFTTATDIASIINQNFHKAVASALDSTRVDINVPGTGYTSVPDLISRVQNFALDIIPPARIIVNERTGTIVLGGDVKLSPVSVIHGDLSVEVVTSYAVAPVPYGPGPYGMPQGGFGGYGPYGQGAEGGGPGGAQPYSQSAPGAAPAQAAGPGGGYPGPGGGPGAGGAGMSPYGNPAALVPETNVNVIDRPAKSMKLEEGANVQELVNGLHAIGATAHDVVSILQAIKAAGGIQADLEVQ